MLTSVTALHVDKVFVSVYGVAIGIGWRQPLQEWEKELCQLAVMANEDDLVRILNPLSTTLNLILHFPTRTLREHLRR